MMESIFNTDPSFQPVYWIIFYVSATIILVSGGRLFWSFNMIICVVSMVFLLIFCFGSLPWVNFQENALLPLSNCTGNNDIALADCTTNDEQPVDQYMSGGFDMFMFILPLTCWWYVGIESLGFSADVLSAPKTEVPIANITCMLYLFCSSILVLFVCVSLPPGIEFTSTSLNPLNNGFIYSLSISQTWATVLSIPAVYATAWGFMYPASKLIFALSESNLIHKVFKLTSKERKTQYTAIIFVSVTCLLICVLFYQYKVISLYLFNFCILSASSVYMSQCLGYIVFRQMKLKEKPEFTSPFGIVGAAYAFVIFLFIAISVIGYQKDDHYAFYAFMCMVMVFSLYYFAFAIDGQKFSDDEVLCYYFSNLCVYYLFLN